MQLKEVGKKAQRILESCLSSLLEIINGEEDEAETADVNFIGVASQVKSDLERSATKALAQQEKYSERLSELRNILHVLRTKEIGEEDVSGNPETTEKTNAAKSLIKPLFAELLLQCRELVREEETALMEELDEAQGEAKEARLAVFKALREDGGENNGLPSELQDAIAETNFGENIEIQLLAEEILSKVREVEKEYEEAMGSISKNEVGAAEGEESEIVQTTFVKVVKEWERKSKVSGSESQKILS